MKFNKGAIAMLEVPWLKKQIETHIFFGFCARSLPLALLWLVICVLAVLYVLFSGELGLRAIAENIQYLFFIVVGVLLLKLSKYHQAAIGWWAVKASSFFLCLAFLVVGGLVGFFRGNPDAIHMTLLGLVWFPGPEFISKITEQQKYLTIGRIIITIPIAILGYQTGNWH
jgi:hypothetical protein